jgi:NAD(P)-dependent dehydrogenase (short-subunit alcohol dehydrogenase family)
MPKLLSVNVGLPRDVTWNGKIVRTGASPVQPEPQLAGQTVVVIGGSSGIGLETARRARAEGGKLILAERNPERLEHASRELGTLSSAAFDATDFDQLKKFFDGLPTPIDHVLVTGPGPYYSALAEFEIEKARRDVEARLLLPLHHRPAGQAQVMTMKPTRGNNPPT